MRQATSGGSGSRFRAPARPDPDGLWRRLAAVVLGLTFGPQHRAGAAAEAGGRCTAAAPTTAAGYQRMFDGLYGRWAGGDQAVSVALPDGRTLWIFADTISGERAPDGGYAAGWTMRHNSFVVQDGGCLTAIAGTPLPDRAPATGTGRRRR